MEIIKNYSVSLLNIVIVIILFTFWRGERYSKNLYKDKIEVMNDSIKSTINKNGNLEAEKRGLEISLSDLKNENNILGIDKKKLKQEIGNLSNLVAFYKVKANVSKTIETNVRDTVIMLIGSDTISYKGVSFDWSNEWLNISGLYIPNTRKITLRYDYRFDYNIYSYRKRDPKWKVWKPKELYVKVEFKDPTIQVTQLDYVKIADRPKFYEKGIFKYGVGFLAGFILFKL
jgi:uncharacterized protein YxeA